jgi:hypothetical protein
MGETAPELEMNVLEQVAAGFEIKLVGSREPVECCAPGFLTD